MRIKIIIKLTINKYNEIKDTLFNKNNYKINPQP